MAVSTQLTPAFLTFLEHLEIERNVSHLTIRNYGHYLRRFIQWLESQGKTDVTQIDSDLVRSYRVYLARLVDSQGRTLSKKNSKLSCHCFTFMA